jgi:DNA polymerase III sliding clamp (beta) subunit (PCNA family)
MKIIRDQLLSTLHNISHGLSTGKEILEQSASFVFKDGRVMTFNDELLCSVPNPLDIEGAIEAKPLINILQKLPDEEIRLDMDKGKLRLFGKKRRASIAMDAEVVLPVDGVDIPTDWEEAPPELAACITSAAECASKDTQNFTLVCIHIHPDYVEACDNYQVIRYNFPTGVKEPTLVRATAVKALTTISPTHISSTEGFLHFKNEEEDLILSCRKYNEEYNDLSNVANFEGGSLYIPTGLIGAADRAGVFAADSEKQVQVLLKGNKARLVGRSASGSFEEVMAVKYDGEDASFFIRPKLLAALVDRGGRAIVGPRSIKIEDDTAPVHYTYVAATSQA